MKQDNIFIYSWFIDEKETEFTKIRAYALDENNKTICLHIDDFTPYTYIELPQNTEWNERKAQLLGNKLDEILGETAPLRKGLIMKHKLYGAHIDSNGKKKIFPYLFCSFANRSHINRVLVPKLRKGVNVQGIGYVKLKAHETDADPILQLVSCKDIPSVGWVKFIGEEVPEENKVTLCDKEYNVKWKGLFRLDKNTVAHPLIMGFDIEVNSTNPTAMPKAKNPGDKVFQVSCVFSRDGSNVNELYLLTLGEVNKEHVGEDVNIILCETEADLLTKFTELVREKNPNVISGYNILGFDIQYMIDRAKFNMCVGSFDRIGFHKYNHANERKIKWSSSAFKNQEFDYLDGEGRIFVDLLPLIRRDYKFSNYKLKTVSEEILKDDTKDDLSIRNLFRYYKIGMQRRKDGTFSNKSKKAMGIIGKYCMQDSVLCVKLMEKMQTWIGLTEFAKTVNTGIFSLYTQGQQIKVYSQIYAFCLKNNIVVEKDVYIVKEGERYAGAHVFPPVPGLYDRVLPFDFASLYPTTMIAYNIDYSTWVTDEKIPDDKCNVMKWVECMSCEHDPKVIKVGEITKYIEREKKYLKELRTERDKKCNKLAKHEFVEEINKRNLSLKPYIEERAKIKKTILKNPLCGERYYRFYKEIKGVVPTILQNLLDARKHTRKLIKESICKDENCKKIAQYGIDKSIFCEIHKEDRHNKLIEDEKVSDIKVLNSVLDKRQLAYKVSCNSAYGAYGVKKGYLPLMCGAQSVTYMGRTNIEKVADVIQKKYGGQLVYGDTDCVVSTEPVIIQYEDMGKTVIDYKTVEEISDGNWTRINPNKEISKAKKGYKIWSDQGFTNIINVVRCGVKKDLSRVLTHVGVISCSNEHSLLRENLESVTPLDIKTGDKLCISNLPLPNDTPKYPIYNNKLTTEVIKNYEIPDIMYNNISAELAFVWGLFFADGSCGTYIGSNGYEKSTWAINNQDNKLLEKCCDILIRNEKILSFKILETMKYSHVNKLVAKQFSKTSEHAGTIVTFVNKYRELFYDNRKYKKIPYIIFNSPLEIRQSFFMGYYAGDGSKKDPAISLSNKGSIGSAGLFYLMRSIGYQVSINTRTDKPDIYKLTGSNPEKKQRYTPNAVKKITPIKSNENEYIYDIQTENHHFAAGVGELVVHNSNYITFPHLKTAEESWDYAEKVAEEVSSLFPKPIALAFEEAIYWQFLILSKKRYLYKECGRDGIISNKIGRKGVLLARRDNSIFIRNLYEKIIGKIFDRVNRDDILYFIIQEINNLFSNSLPSKSFTITKSVGDIGCFTETKKESQYVIQFKDEKGRVKGKIGSYTVPLLSEDEKERDDQLKKKEALSTKEFYEKCLPAQVQLAEKMRRRGARVEAGSRLEYLIIEHNGGHKGKQYEKIESLDYFMNHKDVLKVDFFYYLENMINPVDEVLNVLYNKDDPTYTYKFKKDFIQEQYNFRYKVREKMMNELRDLFMPKLWFTN